VLKPYYARPERPAHFRHAGKRREALLEYKIPADSSRPTAGAAIAAATLARAEPTSIDASKTMPTAPADISDLPLEISPAGDPAVPFRPDDAIIAPATKSPRPNPKHPASVT
jgi:hypothetical protein